jgi:hypothetical protein
VVGRVLADPAFLRSIRSSVERWANQELNKKAKVSRRMWLAGREVATILGILLVLALVNLGVLVGRGGGGTEKGQGGDDTRRASKR